MFLTDQAALDALSAIIFASGFSLDVTFEDGEVIARNLVSPSAVYEAASCTGDPVLLVVRRDGMKDGVFVVLLQDDPDCLVVDHSDNVVCNHLFNRWFALAEAGASAAA